MVEAVDSVALAGEVEVVVASVISAAGALEVEDSVAVATVVDWVASGVVVAASRTTRGVAGSEDSAVAVAGSGGETSGF